MSVLEETVEQAYEALDAGEIERAILLGRRALEIAPRDPDAHFVVGSALFESGDATGALPHLEAAAGASPDSADALCALGAAFVESLRVSEARPVLERAIALDRDLADAHFWLGVIDERAGDREEADRRFERAHRLDPDSHPTPFRVDPPEFLRLVEQAIARLPADFRAELENLAIVVEPLPDDRTLAGDPPLSPLLLGLQVGTPLDERLPSGPRGELPGTIFLFQRNIERVSRDRAQLLEEIETTLLHEIGHFLGLDEDEVHDRGLE